jgi:hypothetical protein
MLNMGLKIDLLKYHFIEKLEFFISSLKYLSIPFIYKFKISFKEYIGKINKIEKILKNYCVAFLYVEALSEKIANSKEEIINNIEYVWKNIEKNEEKVLNITFNWNIAFEKLLEELDSMKIKANSIERKIIEYFKERINKNKEKLFKDLKNFSRNPNEYIPISIRISEKSFIGMISGIIVTMIFYVIHMITSPFISSLFNIVAIHFVLIFGFSLGLFGSIIISICDSLPIKRLKIKKIISVIIFSLILLYVLSYVTSLLIKFIKIFEKIFPYIFILIHTQSFLLMIATIVYSYLFVFINEKITLKYLKLRRKIESIIRHVYHLLNQYLKMQE